MTFGLNKTFTYCVMHLLVAMAVAYALTWNLAAAFAIGLIEPMVQTVAYNFHERYWARREAKAAPQGVALSQQGL
ncbi:MAG: DUF2061 domain-containing protein [Pseudomonadota bacterium]